MTETEWFDGSTVCDSAGQAFYLVRVGVLLAILIWLLAGCAAQPVAKKGEGPSAMVCYLKGLGQTEQGYTVVLQQCVTPEAFAESQK